MRVIREYWQCAVKQEIPVKAIQQTGKNVGAGMLPYLFLLTYASLFAIILFNVKMYWLRGLVMPKKLTTEEFIERAKAVHGNKYDYSKTVYKNAMGKVIIICPIHGEFEQVAHNHADGHGCPKCGGKMKLTSEEQVVLITKKNHNVKVLGEIVDNKTPVLCLCKICNHKWYIRPYDLKYGKSCPKCSGNIRKTTEKFIQEARVKHGGKYDYSKVEYVSAHKSCSWF